MKYHANPAAALKRKKIANARLALLSILRFIDLCAE
jgi:hypothetical protein